MVLFPPASFAASYGYDLHAIYTFSLPQGVAPCWKAFKKEGRKDCRTVSRLVAMARKADVVLGATIGNPCRPATTAVQPVSPLPR